MLGLFREELPEAGAGSGATVLRPPIRWTQPGKTSFSSPGYVVFGKAHGEAGMWVMSPVALSPALAPAPSQELDPAA